MKILILVYFCFYVDSHTFLNLENDPLAFCSNCYNLIAMYWIENEKFNAQQAKQFYRFTNIKERKYKS
jgi:hypothetical protein